MTPERWQRLQEIFVAAEGIDAIERPRFIQESCGMDQQLSNMVLSLLSFEHPQTGPIPEPVSFRMRATAEGEPQPGDTLGAYRIVREISRGGMGIVFLAQRDDEQFRRRVAIKVIQERIQSSEGLSRFHSERQILASLDHPNIARLLDAGIVPRSQSPYLVMEYVEGVPLMQFCERESLAMRDRLVLFQSVCSAVHAAHRNLVVHRDIKPDNILVTSGGVPKLLDFGIAKMLRPEFLGLESIHTQLSSSPMTPDYAAPEQVSGAAITTATDVYALGLILYELLTGTRPYRIQNYDLPELYRVICQQEPERPSTRMTSENPSPTEATRQITRELRGDLDAIILKTLRKEPEERYSSADELSADIQRFLNSQPVLAHDGNWTYLASKFVRRHRIGVVLAAVVSLLIVGFGISMAVMAQRLAHERTTALEVSKFLTSIFESADPNQARDKEVTARQLLDAGAERARKEFSNRPEVLAPLLRSLGRTYCSLGQYDQSESLLKDALKVDIDKSGRAETLLFLGETYLYSGKKQEAEATLREALPLQISLTGTQSINTARVQNGLGSVLMISGRLEESESFYSTSLETRRKLFTTDSMELQGAINDLALIKQGRGDTPSAEQLMRESINLRRLARVKNDPQLSTGVFNLGAVLAEKLDFFGAEALLRESLQIQRAIFPDGGPIEAQTSGYLARVLIGEGNLEEAAKLLGVEAGTSVYGKALQKGHGLTDLAALYQASGRLDLAIETIRKAIDLYTQKGGPNHYAVGSALSQLTTMLYDKGDFAGAEDAQRRSLEIRQKSATYVGNPASERFKVVLALTLHAQGKDAEAAQIFTASLPIVREKLALDDGRRARADMAYGRFLIDKGDALAAKPYLREAVKILTTLRPETHFERAEANAYLAAALLKTNQPSDAQPLLAAARKTLQSDRYPQRCQQTLAWLEKTIKSN